MCDTRRPLNGADSLPADEPRAYRVNLRGKWDDTERKTITVTAYGPRDIDNQVRAFHPGYFVTETQVVAP